MEFAIEGRNLDLLPNDIIGVVSNHNDNPLEGRYSVDDNFYCQVVSITTNTLVLSARSAVPHGALYLGGIVSNDRTVVYWQNDSAPLP